MVSLRPLFTFTDPAPKRRLMHDYGSPGPLRPAPFEGLFEVCYGRRLTNTLDDNGLCYCPPASRFLIAACRLRPLMTAA